MNTRENFHDTPAEMYARLVSVFGETEHSGTKWVEIGAGSVALTFFAPSVIVALEPQGAEAPTA